METGTALVRACIKIMELSKKMKIDVINMSYGEHAHWSNAGCVLSYGATCCCLFTSKFTQVNEDQTNRVNSMIP